MFKAYIEPDRWGIQGWKLLYDIARELPNAVEAIKANERRLRCPKRRQAIRLSRRVEENELMMSLCSIFDGYCKTQR